MRTFACALGFVVACAHADAPSHPAPPPIDLSDPLALVSAESDLAISGEQLHTLIELAKSMRDAQPSND